MRRFWAFICMVCSLLVVVLFNSQAVINGFNTSLEYSGGREVVFQLTEREGGINLTSSYISDKIMGRLDLAGANNSRVEVVKSEDSNPSFEVRVSVSTNTTSEYNNIVRILKSNTGNTSLSISTATDYVVKGSDFFDFDKDIMQLNYNGVSPLPAFVVGSTTVFDELKNKAAEAESEDVKKTLYVWENKTDEDTYDTAFGKENGREDVKAKIIATLSVDDYDSTNEIINISKDEAGNEFTISSARSYVNARNATDYGFDIEFLYDNYIKASYPTNALTLSIVGFCAGIALLFVGLSLLYGFSGLVSSVSILFGSLIQAMIFSFLGFEFTPISISAMVLTVGLASFIQFNYFERIKAELSKGRTINKANSEGYRKSFAVTLDSCVIIFFTSLFAFLLGKGMIRTFAGVALIGSLTTFLIVNYFSKWMMYWLTTAPFFNKGNRTFGLRLDNKGLIVKLKKDNYINNNNAKKNRNISFISLAASIGICAISVLAISLSSGVSNIFNNSGDYGQTYRLDAKFTTLRSISDDNTVVDATEFIDAIQTADTTLSKLNDIVVSTTFNRVETVDENYVDTYTSYVSLETNRLLTDDEFGAFRSIVEGFDWSAGYSAEIKVTSSVSKTGESVHNSNSMFLILGLTIIFAATYYLLRYGISVALSSIITSTIPTVLTVALLAITRLPVNSTSLFSILIGLMIINILYLTIFARNKELIKDTKLRILTSEQRLEILNQSINFSIVPTLYTAIATIIVMIVFSAFVGVNAITLCVGVILSLILGLLSSLFISPNMYYFFKTNIKFSHKVDVSKLSQSARNRRLALEEQEKNEPRETIVPGIND